MSTENSARIARYNMEHITDTAMELFFSKGIKVTSVDEIAKLGKISRVTIYKYFPTKLDIAVSVFRRYLHFGSPIIKDTFFSASYTELNGFEQIRLQLSIYSKIHLENPVFLPFISELDIIVSEIDTESEIKRQNALINKNFDEFYMNAIRKGLQDGSIFKRAEFETSDYLYVRKIIEGLYIRCYLCFGREHFIVNQKEVYNELNYAVDKISVAFFKP